MGLKTFGYVFVASVLAIFGCALSQFQDQHWVFWVLNGLTDGLLIALMAFALLRQERE